jgi:tetratricopeptide (TPR) repeat protein
MKDYNQALINFQQVMIMDNQINAGDDKKANTLRNIGICYQNLNDFDNCIINLIQSLEIRLKQKNKLSKYSLVLRVYVNKSYPNRINSHIQIISKISKTRKQEWLQKKIQHKIITLRAHKN